MARLKQLDQTSSVSGQYAINSLGNFQLHSFITCFTTIVHKVTKTIKVYSSELYGQCCHQGVNACAQREGTEPDKNRTTLNIY